MTQNWDETLKEIQSRDKVAEIRKATDATRDNTLELNIKNFKLTGVDAKEYRELDRLERLLERKERELEERAISLLPDEVQLVYYGIAQHLSEVRTKYLNKKTEILKRRWPSEEE